MANCCPCNGAQVASLPVTVASSIPPQIYHTDRQYVSGASGFDSPFNAPEIPLYRVRVPQPRQASPPLLLVALLIAGVVYLYYTKKGA